MTVLTNEHEVLKVERNVKKSNSSHVLEIKAASGWLADFMVILAYFNGDAIDAVMRLYSIRFIRHVAFQIHLLRLR